MPITSTRKGIVFCAFAAASALGWTWSPQTIDKKISAGAIEFSPEYGPAGHKLVGSFKISTSPSQNAIRSNGTGGACLVADLNRFDKPTRASNGQNRKCTKNSDCKAGLPSSWSGYCDVDGGKTCWVRPGDLAKPRYPEHAPLESFSRVYPGPVRWRVVACLNGIDPTTQQYYPGCGVTDPEHKEMRMEVLGPIRTPPHVPNPGPNR